MFLQLFLSTAMAASTMSLQPTIEHMNQILPKDQQFSLADTNGEKFYNTLHDLDGKKDPKELEKEYLALDEIPGKTCDVLGASSYIPKLYGFQTASNATEKDILETKDFSKSLKATRIALRASQCQGLIIYDLVSFALLWRNLETLQKVKPTSLTAEEKSQLDSLKKEISSLDILKISRESVRIETLSMYAIVSSGDPSDVIGGPTDVWGKVFPQKMKVNWSEEAPLVKNFFNNIQDSKDLKFDKYNELLYKTATDGREQFYKKLKLSEYGLKEASDLRNGKEYEAFLKNLRDNPSKMETLKKQASQTDITNDISHMAFNVFGHFEKSTEKLTKSDSRVKDLAKNLD